MKSLDGGREDVGKLLALLSEGGLHDDAVNILEVGDLLECVVFGVVLEQLVEGVADEERILELGQLPELIELVPALNLVV